MSEPLIDVIIAVYNGELFIADAIASVQDQSWVNLNIIITDDGSTDTTVPIVTGLSEADSRIKLILQSHGGVSTALNNAITHSTADYIAFLDADDLWHPQKLERQMKILADTTAEICFCLIQEFETLSEVSLPTHRARLQPMKGYSKIAFLGYRHVFKTYGLFDENISTGDFIEWFSRVVRAQQPVMIIEDVLAYRRVHHQNTTSTANKNGFLKLLKVHLDEKTKSKSK
jgi:glycosyltransferase involved in cell wall biosynthesis